mgnify:CR=1 FL=1
MDEVGCGCWAGPLVSAAVILPPDFKDPGIKDSKLLTESKREVYNNFIIKKALSFGIGEVSVEEIDKLGLSKAKLLSVNKALENLNIKPDHVLIDGYHIDIDKYSSKAIIRGDQKVKSIACASIIAKVYRDRIITNLAAKYSNYKFEKNKGYGTGDHIKALEKYGICAIHRRSYQPIKKILNKK